MDRFLTGQICDVDQTVKSFPKNCPFGLPSPSSFRRFFPIKTNLEKTGKYPKQMLIDQRFCLRDITGDYIPEKLDFEKCFSLNDLYKKFGPNGIEWPVENRSTLFYTRSHSLCTIKLFLLSIFPLYFFRKRVRELCKAQWYIERISTFGCPSLFWSDEMFIGLGKMMCTFLN